MSKYGKKVTLNEIETNPEYKVLHDAIRLLSKRGKFQSNPEIAIIAQMLLGMEWYILPKDSEYVAFVAMEVTNESRPTITLHVNPYHELMQDYRNVRYILFHEMLHVIGRHNQKAKGKDPQLWNLATDHFINTTLDSAIRKDSDIANIVSTPKDVFKIDHQDWDEQNTFEKTEEDAYRWLLKQQEKNPQQIEQMIKEFMENGLGDVQESDGNDGGDADDESGNIVPISPEMENDISSKVKSMRDVMRGNKSKGNISNPLENYLDKILEVKIPWETILENSIAMAMDKKEDRSYAKPNLMMRHIRLVPGVIPEPKVDELVVVIDQSGSISIEELQIAAGIVKQAADNFKYIRVMHHDTVVTFNKRFESEEDEMEIEEAMLKITGGGGTSHKQVFNILEKLIEEEFEDHDDDYEEENVSCILFFTDMGSDILTTMKEDLREFPMFWVVPKNHDKETASKLENVIVVD